MRLNAILPHISSFVSASAGTGKTKILIDRLVSLLLHGVLPNKILCLAFTKAAAAEILARLNNKLAQLCMSSEEELLPELHSLGFNEPSLKLIHTARTLFSKLIDSTEPVNIQTIHSFCQKLLTQFPFEAGININFTLLDENQVSSLIKKAKEILLNAIDDFPQLSIALKYLSWHIKEYSLTELLNEIIANREKLDRFFRSKPNLDLTLNIDEETIITEFIKHIPKFDIDSLHKGGKTDITRGQNIAYFLDLSSSNQITQINKYLDCFLTNSKEPIKSLISKKLSEDYPELATNLYAEQGRVYKFSQEFNQYKINNLTQSFIILSSHIREVYKNLKKQNNYLDYDDLINLAADLLSNDQYSDWIRYKLDGGIDHILVDEAQDNSFNQWLIINKISEEFFYNEDQIKSLFIVGDSKQSIFKFQGADPDMFDAMNQYLPDNVNRLELNTSFRSADNILEFIDNIFNQNHLKPLVTKATDIKHFAYHNFSGGIEIWPLVIEAENKANSAWLLPQDYKNDPLESAEDILATKITNTIKQWLDQKIFLHSKKRSITPGDILILSRRRNNFVHILIKTLKQYNIPVTPLDKMTLTEHPAILDLIALSEFLLYKEDDLNLAIILKSPLFNLTEEDLIFLCSNRENTLWSKLKQTPQYQQTYDFLETLTPVSIFSFFFELLETKGFRKIYQNHYGNEVNDVLDSFLDVVEKFENENISSLQLFIDFLNNSQIEIKRDLTHNSQQVRVMTVHGAKGLQAPIVILADTTSLPNNDETIIWLNENELLWPGKAKYYNEQIMHAKAKLSAQEYAEYVRLLYVAITRAEEKFICTGIAKNDKISDKSWYRILSSIT
jgi:ATP-dependent helicase/nuclease subunit A